MQKLNNTINLLPIHKEKLFKAAKITKQYWKSLVDNNQVNIKVLKNIQFQIKLIHDFLLLDKFYLLKVRKGELIQLNKKKYVYLLHTVDLYIEKLINQNTDKQHESIHNSLTTPFSKHTPYSGKLDPNFLKSLPPSFARTRNSQLGKRPKSKPKS